MARKVAVEEVIGVDFETDAIESRPAYPPKPVGASIQYPGEKKPTYYAWGHPTGNNCTPEQGKKAVLKAWKDKRPKLFHHAKFDMDVAETHLGAPPLNWNEFHDSVFILFLHDPHAMSFQLKPAAEKWLGMSPKEQVALREWLVKNKIVKANDSKWGAHISKAPGGLTGKYAEGDVIRSAKLYQKLYPLILAAGMGEAYDRERKLLPIFLESERIGMRVDVAALERDIAIYKEAYAEVEYWLAKRFKVKYGTFNFDSDAAVGELLDDLGIVSEWVLTKTGKKSVAKKYMTFDKFKDKKVFYALGYRNRLATCLRMFMEPWLEEAKRTGGFIQPNWNQVRQSKGSGDDTQGTRTGRPSCTNPNLLNVSKSFYDRGDFYEHPKFIPNLPELPLVRKYCLADKGCVWLHRDYNQQELRLLAHFEDGLLMAAYKENPKMDVHTFIQGAVKDITGIQFDRVSIKTTVFGRIYGQGLGGLAEKLNVPVVEVKQVRDAQNQALPGLSDIDKAIKDMAKRGEPIITWGGRVYYVEEPKYVEKFGREMTFEYKLLNYLIQGSAADCTKEAIIRFYYHPKRKASWRFIVTVYDEINICAPKAEAKAAMALLRECMESIEIDIPMLTDGKIGPNWGTLTKEKAA